MRESENNHNLPANTSIKVISDLTVILGVLIFLFFSFALSLELTFGYNSFGDGAADYSTANLYRLCAILGIIMIILGGILKKKSVNQKTER